MPLRRIGTRGSVFWIPQWTVGFHKVLGISWLAEELLASQEELSSAEVANTPRPWYTPFFPLTPPRPFTPLLNLRSLIFGITPLDLLCSVTTISPISYRNTILDLSLFMYAHFIQELQSDRKTIGGGWVHGCKTWKTAVHMFVAVTLSCLFQVICYTWNSNSREFEMWFGGLRSIDRCGLRYRPHSCLFG